MRDVAVVVVSYQAPEWTQRCLDSLTQAAAQSRYDVAVVVVDNASDAATRAVVAAADVRHIQLDENIGFGRACNHGVALTSSRLVLLVNPDTLVTAQALDALVAFHDADPRRGIVGGRTVSPDGVLDPRSCWAAMSMWSLFCYATGLSSAFRGNAVLDPESLGSWQRDTVREVDVVTGCLLLASREVWQQLGGFDEDFFMYGEDADLSRRARQAGYRPAVTPAAEIVHAVGASSDSTLAKQRLLLRGRATLVAKQWHGWQRHLARTFLVTGVAIRAVGARRSPWAVLWRDRRMWIDGWPPFVPVGTGPVSERAEP